VEEYSSGWEGQDCRGLWTGHWDRHNLLLYIISDYKFGNISGDWEEVRLVLIPLGAQAAR
jgi:hypothetical protein